MDYIDIMRVEFLKQQDERARFIQAEVAAWDISPMPLGWTPQPVLTNEGDRTNGKSTDKNRLGRRARR